MANNKNSKLKNKNTYLLLLFSVLGFVVLALFLVLRGSSYFKGEDADIFVATPSGAVTLQVESSDGNLNFTPGQTKTMQVKVKSNSNNSKAYALGFILEYASSVTVSDVAIGGGLPDPNLIVAKVVENNTTDKKINFVVATEPSDPFNLPVGAVVATFKLKAPSSGGAVSGAVKKVTTTSLPSIIDTNEQEVMNSASLSTVNINVSNPTLSAPTFSFNSDRVYNTNYKFTINGPSGATIYYCFGTGTGCNPTTQYSGEITHNSGTGYYRAIAKRSGYTDSSITLSKKLTKNSAPTIGSVSAGGTEFVTGTNVTVSANSVADSVGGVKDVKFYRVTSNGDTLLSTDTTSPYTHTISNADIARYTIKAVVEDTYGLKASKSTTFNVIPKKPTFTPNTASAGDSITVTINNPNGTGTVKFDACSGCDPIRTYTGPVSVTGSGKLSAKVEHNGQTSEIAVSGTYTINGKVETPAVSPSAGYYLPSEGKSVTLSSATSGATIQYCTTSNLSATSCSNYLNYTSGTNNLNLGQSNFKLFARATKSGFVTSDTVSATYRVLGDVNNDGNLTIDDVIGQIQVLVKGNGETDTMDVNKDGIFNLRDIIALIIEIYAK